MFLFQVKGIFKKIQQQRILSDKMGGRYKFLSEQSYFEALIDEAQYYDLPFACIELLHEIRLSKFWHKKFDGQTLLKSNREPDLTATVHDYHAITGQGGIIADRLFYWLSIKTDRNIPKLKYLGVRIGWLGFLKWKHKIDKNVKPMTHTSLKLYEIAKREMKW